MHYKPLHGRHHPSRSQACQPDGSTSRREQRSRQSDGFRFAGFTAKPHIHLAELTGKGPIYAMGTPAYVSPEMVRGDTVDHRSDLYAVGIILYEMLSGRLPFNSNHVERLLNSHLREPPPPFAKIGFEHCPPGLEAVVQRILSKYPNERPQSAHELVDAISRVLGSVSISGKRPPRWAGNLPRRKSSLRMPADSCPCSTTLPRHP